MWARAKPRSVEEWSSGQRHGQSLFSHTSKHVVSTRAAFTDQYEGTKVPSYKALLRSTEKSYRGQSEKIVLLARLTPRVVHTKPAMPGPLQTLIFPNKGLDLGGFMLNRNVGNSQPQ